MRRFSPDRVWAAMASISTSEFVAGETRRTIIRVEAGGRPRKLPGPDHRL